jgi:hypothetical protein
MTPWRVGIHKPGWYESEADFMTEMFRFAKSCTRHYFIEK